MIEEIVGIWALCAVWAYGRFLAEAYGSWPSCSWIDAPALLLILIWGGPVMVAASVFECRGGHGVQFLPRRRENQ